MPAALGRPAFAALELVSQRKRDAFSVHFNLFSRLSVFEVRGRTVGTRPLLSGLARLDTPPGTVAVVVVMVGSVTFGGLSAGLI